jgi:hypothetical protein
MQCGGRHFAVRHNSSVEAGIHKINVFLIQPFTQDLHRFTGLINFSNSL